MANLSGIREKVLENSDYHRDNFIISNTSFEMRKQMLQFSNLFSGASIDSAKIKN